MSNVALPNSFQHPNILIDKLAYFLTPEEEKVLNKAVREILGWQDKVENRRARIAISIFVEGKFKKDLPKTEENRLAYGCGLSENTVRQVLKSLHTFGILTRVGEANRDGQEYELQLDGGAIDWLNLQKRKDEKQNKNKYRTETARELNPLNNGVLSDSTPGQNGVQCDSIPPVLSDSRGGVLSGEGKETHSQTHSQTQILPNGNSGETPQEAEGQEDSKKWDNANKKIVGDKFFELTHLKKPTNKKTVGAWWGWLYEIFELANKDPTETCRIMAVVVEDMQRKHLTISSPKSLHWGARAVTSGQSLNRTQKNGRNQPKNKPAAERGPISPEEWKRMVEST